MAISVASSLTFEGACCSTSYAFTRRWKRSSVDVSGRNPTVGSTELHWLSKGRDLGLSKVAVSADYSDSVPDSTSYLTNKGYHPLEDIKVCKRARTTELTAAQVARTTVEVNSNALLLFPGGMHSEPHEQVSWDDFHYVIDDYGDLYFQIFDPVNMLEDRGASSPVNALIGMDLHMYESRRIIGDYIAAADSGNTDFAHFYNEYIEAMEADLIENAVDWGVSDVNRLVHPIYFAKCLDKAIEIEYEKKMKHPSNGVSIMGCLRPADDDEVSYIRTLPRFEESEDNTVWEGLDDEGWNFKLKSDRSNQKNTFYKLEMMEIELFSMYGIQSEIEVHDYKHAEPDILMRATAGFVERFSERRGISYNIALKALCKKKGLRVEDAILIGVDTLGMDVRVCIGTEVRTLRFSFKIRARTKGEAEKQIEQLLFPRSRRKKLRSHGDGLRDTAAKKKG